MINWTLLSPRNLFAVGAMALIAYFIFNHFTKARLPVAAGA